LQTAKAWAPGAAEAATPASPATPSAGAAPEKKKDSGAKSAEALLMKAKLEALEKELDLLERELPLERNNYYTKPDYQHDTAGKAKLDALQQQITDKQQEVDTLKTRLAALMEQLTREQPASP
jgi:type I restriction-modification system DNA methylase subunit